MAQTTQFTAPGWHYLDSSSGYIGGNRNNGSYVSLKSTNNRDYSTIIETMDATAAQTAQLHRHRRAVHRCRARVVDQHPVQQPRRLLRAGQRHHAVRRQLLAHRAARLRLQHHHHDRTGQGNRDQPGAGRAERCRTATPSTATRSAARRRTYGPAGLVRGRRLRRRSRRAVRAADVGAGADLLDVGPCRSVRPAGRPDLAQLHRLLRRHAGEVRLRAAHRRAATPTTTRGRRT